MNAEYPVCLNLGGKECLIVGGGCVAERKVSTLLKCGAVLTLISPRITDKIQAWVHDGAVIWKARVFEAGDTKEFAVVFCATDSAEVNNLAASEAKEHGAWVNIADNPGLSDFTIPASVRYGDMTITVSTNGRSPAAARELRKDLSVRYGPEYGEYIDIIGSIRDEWRETEESCARRQARWKDFQGFDPEVLRLLREGRRKEAEERVRYDVGCSGPES